jgi:hypothetical protein
MVIQQVRIVGLSQGDWPSPIRLAGGNNHFKYALGWLPTIRDWSDQLAIPELV